MKLTMKDFVKASESKKAKKANFMVVYIQVGDGFPEAIINPKENFEAKIEYYKNAYDEELRLKTNSEVKMIDYDFVKYVNVVKF